MGKTAEMIKTGTRVFFAAGAIIASVLFIEIVFLDINKIAETQSKCVDNSPRQAFFSSPDLISCTIFTVCHGDTVFFGNNEDWKNPKTYCWATPSINQNYGVVYFGFDNFQPQGGINEKGLVFDVNALPRSPLNPHPELPMVRKPFYEFLQTCATVEEIIEKVKLYSWERSWKAQLHVADRMGNAVVISAGQNGEIAFTRKKDDTYLLSTNFNLANPENGQYPCWRYNTASGMLKKMQHEDTLKLDYCRSILDAVHVEGASVNTVYSNIFDLTNGIIYLYHWHHYDEVVEINVAEKVTTGFEPIRIKDLFSQKTVDHTSKEYFSYQKKIRFWKTVTRIWLILAGASMMILFYDLAAGPPFLLGMGLAWELVMVIFGPLGLVAYWYSYRQSLRSPTLPSELTIWKQALGKTVFDVAGYSMGMAIGLSTFYLIWPLNESSPWSIAARCCGLPLITGGVFFHISVLAALGGDKYWRVVRHRIKTGIISLTLSLVGMLPVAGIFMILTEKHLGMDGPGNPIFLGVIILSAFSGALIVYPFSVWRVRRGFYLGPRGLLAGREK